MLSTEESMFWTVVLEKTLESPLVCKEITPVHPKGNQSWMFIGRTDAPILWPPDVKNWLIGKDPDAGKDWRQEEKEAGSRGWDGWMASLTQWTWVWTNFCRQWRTEKTGVLKSAESQRAGCNSMTEQTKIKPNGYVWIFVLKCRYTSNFTFWYSIAWMRLNLFFSIAEPLFH